MASQESEEVGQKKATQRGRHGTDGDERRNWNFRIESVNYNHRPCGWSECGHQVNAKDDPEKDEVFVHSSQTQRNRYSMQMIKTQPIPEHYRAITPYLCIKGASKAIEFYKHAFGAKENYRISMADGTIAHAEIEIGDSKIMLSEENEQWRNWGPKTIGGTPVSLALYVEDVDAVFAKAIALGATAIGEGTVKDQFHGDRTGSVMDPFGHQWVIMTHIEDVAPEELQRRADVMFSQNTNS